MPSNSTRRRGRSRAIASLGVDWHLPDSSGGYRKRRFATTTQADSDMIDLLASDGLTWSQIKGRLLFASAEQAVIVDRFVAEGLGDVQATVHLRAAGADAPNRASASHINGHP
jgi:hypothetical protein